MTRPSLFLVGAPRSGTTSLYHYLRAHPEIAVGSHKEPHYFAADLQDPGFFRGEAAYVDLYAHSITARYALDGSVWYLYSSVAAERIHQFNSNARILASLRHPADMLLSIHNHHVYTGYEKLEGFRSAYRRPEVSPQPATSFREELPYRRIARYGEQLGRYLDRFGSDQVHVSLYEDLQHDPVNVYRDLMRFLGLPEDNPPEFKTYNAQRRVRSKAVARLQWYIQRKNAASPSPANGLVAAGHKARHLAGRALRLINTEPAQPSMDPRLRLEIISDYRDDILKLGDLIDRDLSHWLK